MALKRINAAVLSAALVSSIFAVPAWAAAAPIAGLTSVSAEVSADGAKANIAYDAATKTLTITKKVAETTDAEAATASEKAGVTLTVAADQKLLLDKLAIGDDVTVGVKGDNSDSHLFIKEIGEAENDTVSGEIGKAILSPAIGYQFTKVDVSGGLANTLPVTVDSSIFPGEVKGFQNGGVTIPEETLVSTKAGTKTTYYVPAGPAASATTFNVAIKNDNNLGGAYTQEITVANKGDEAPEQWLGDAGDKDSKQLPKVQVKAMTSPVGGLSTYVLNNVGANLILNDSVCKGQAQVGYLKLPANGSTKGLALDKLDQVLKVWDKDNKPTEAGKYLLAPIYKGSDCWVDYASQSMIAELGPNGILETPGALKKIDLQNFSIKQAVKDYLSAEGKNPFSRKFIISMLILFSLLGLAATLGNTVAMGGGAPKD